MNVALSGIVIFSSGEEWGTVLLSAYYRTVEVLLLQCRDLRGVAFYEITMML